MKIQQTSENELYIFKGALGSRVSGAVLAIGGAAIGFPFILKADETQDKLIALAIVAVLILFGSLFALLSLTVKIKLLKVGQSEITKKRLIGAAKTDVFNTQNVKAVVHSTSTDYSSSGTDGSSTRNRVGSVVLMLNDGSTVELFSDSKQAGGGFTINGMGLGSLQPAPLRKEAELISKFLGVAIQHEGDLSAVEAFKEVRSMFQPGQPKQTPPVTPVSAQSDSATQAPQQFATPTIPAVPPQSAALPPVQPPVPPSQPAPPSQPTTDSQEQKNPPPSQQGGNGTI